jgi:(p)ppGpp synthase/HD superfamily hydrolase
MTPETFNRLRAAQDFARDALNGVASNGRTGYFHACSVAQAFRSSHLQMVALLHDVLEDTPVTHQGLLNLFAEDVVEAVVVLTRTEGEPYVDYIRRVARHEVASLVKVADLRDNLSTDPPGDLGRRYEAALVYLLQNS